MCVYNVCTGRSGSHSSTQESPEDQRKKTSSVYTLGTSQYSGQGFNLSLTVMFSSYTQVALSRKPQSDQRVNRVSGLMLANHTSISSVCHTLPHT